MQALNFLNAYLALLIACNYAIRPYWAGCKQLFAWRLLGGNKSYAALHSLLSDCFECAYVAVIKHQNFKPTLLCKSRGLQPAQLPLGYQESSRADPLFACCIFLTEREKSGSGRVQEGCRPTLLWKPRGSRSSNSICSRRVLSSSQLGTSTWLTTTCRFIRRRARRTRRSCPAVRGPESCSIGTGRE